MKCPVCETECTGYEKCPQCGFDQLNKLFATKDEIDAWTKQIVEPYRASYLFSPKVFAEAKRKACVTRTNESLDEFYKAFAALVEHDTWVNAPTNGNQLVIVPFRGGHYIAIYSDMNGRAPGDSKDVISTDINKFIDVLYDNPHFLGIVVDPNKDPILINRKAVHVHTKRKDPRLQAKDWGDGIPKYNPKDLMTAEELLDIGMDVVVEHYIYKNGFSIIETHKGTQGFPNFALQKEGVLYLMKVAVGVGVEPILTEQDKAFYLSTSKRFNAICLYAPVVLNSCDEERANNSMALYGDKFYVDFTGAKELY